MNRPYYSEYVRHAMRFYSRTITKSLGETIYFKTSADEKNWMSCDIVLRDYSERDRDILISVYGGYDTLADEVYKTAKENNINQNIIWDMMKDFERKVAKERGLM